MTTTWSPFAPSFSATDTDADLVAACRRGETSACGQIVRRYQALVSGLIYADCGDLHRSEDLAQETFLAAWKTLDTLRDAAKLPAWLCQIARHRLLDAARSRAREAARVEALAGQRRAAGEEVAP